MEKAEKSEYLPAQQSKKPKEATKQKSEKSKEKPTKEKSKPKSATGTSLTDKKSSNELSEEVKTEIPTKATSVKNEEKLSNQETLSEQAMDFKTDDSKKTETDGDKERKIRNKDRPAIQIYRPGAKRLSAQKEKVYLLS